MATKKPKKSIKILLSGGGTMGSVMPLVAIKEELEKSKKDYRFFWIVTQKGPEREFLKNQGEKFKPIFSGKLRRYFDPRNFSDPIFILWGFFQSLYIIFKFKPDLILSAGSFVSVPVAWAGFVFRKPILIHQMDIRPGLANILMAPLAKKITVGFKKSLQDYPAYKTVWTGNPIRNNLKEQNLAVLPNKIKLNSQLPTVLIMGGGTGAAAINKLVIKSLPKLLKFCQVIHITGKGKASFLNDLKHKNNSLFSTSGYFPFEFLADLSGVYKVSQAVVSRCGIGSLSELAFLGKPAILIPLPESHQEENAQVFQEAEAAIVLNQKELFFDVDILVANIKEILYNKKLSERLSKNISLLAKKNASEEIAQNICEVLNKVKK